MKYLFRAVLLLIVLMTAAIAYFYFRDYTQYFHERRATLNDAELSPAGGDSLAQKSWLTLRSTSGLVVECGMLVPRVKEKKFPAIVLMGGKATGKYAVDYALGIPGVIIVAPDYPYTPQDSYTVLSFMGDIPAMRGALLDMVPSVQLLLDYLCQREDVDTSRIILLGYSFGAPLIPPIVVNDRRPSVAALVYGGGDLYSLIRHNVRRYEGAAASEFVALLGALLLRPLEPLRYAADISPTRLLMINGTEDEQIPRANVEKLFDAAEEPKKLIWLESRHVNPRDAELTRRIITILSSELGITP